MSLTSGVTAPRDRASAARTLVGAALFSLIATAGWEIAALATHRGTSTPASALQSVGLALFVLLLARVCSHAPDRVPQWVYPSIAFIAPVMTVVVALASNDGSAAGQLGLVYPVIYAAAHFRRAFAWAVTAFAGCAAALIAFRTLPAPAAVADTVVIVPAMAMITVVLVTLAEHQERTLSRLTELAAADPLTGLATRRELEAVAHRILWSPLRDRGRRRIDLGTSVGLMLIDIDHFKHLNDRFGHPAGDAVLVHVAQLVRASVRDTDTVARMGGDEIAVLLTGSPEHVESRARAICDAVERSSSPTLGDSRLTVSIGVATGRVDGSSFAALYAEADRALYQAKAAGRNNVVSSATSAN